MSFSPPVRAQESEGQSPITRGSAKKVPRILCTKGQKLKKRGKGRYCGQRGERNLLGGIGGI